MIEVRRLMICGTFVYATIDPETESDAIALEEEARLHKVACQECRDFQPVRWPKADVRNERGYSAF